MKPSIKGEAGGISTSLSKLMTPMPKEVHCCITHQSQRQVHDLPTESAAKWLFELVNSDTSSSATSLYDVVPFRWTFSHTFIEKCLKPFPFLSPFLLRLLKEGEKKHLFSINLFRDFFYKPIECKKII